MERRRFVGLMGLPLVTPRAYPLPFDAAPAHPRPPQEDPRAAALGRLVEEKMAAYRIPGVALGLIKDGALVMRGFGLTNLDNPQPVTADTVFPVASITKTVVATATFRLAEEGRLDPEAPVRTYLPDFRVSDERAGRDVRIWHLLTHTPGWEGQLGTPDRGTETLASFTAGLRDLPQLAPPGAVWSYNNAGWNVLGRVIEVVTGGTIHEALASLVFEPLGLAHAFTETGTAMTHRFAAPHREEEGGTVVIRPFALPPAVAAGGSAMSLASLMRYARFHLGDGTVGGRRVLSAESLERMRSPRVVKNATTDEMGMGWHVRRVGSVLTAAHGGTLAGHCLHVQLVPERRLAFAILTNHTDGWRLIQDVGSAILETYEGLALAPGQATGGNRGGNEDMTVHAGPLDPQPAPAPYVGTYARLPFGTAEVSARGAGLVVQGGGAGGDEVPLVFWGPDLAYTAPAARTGSPYLGMPVEFIRGEGGSVGWVRINGRIAAKG